jgi:predicted RNA-binding protein with PIN domain
LEALGKDDDLRAAILRWLDESKSRLTAQQERVLRVVAERAEGWEEQLAKAPPDPPAQPMSEEALSKAPAPDYKAEARRLRAQLRATTRDHAAASAALTRQVAELRSRTETAESAARAAAAAAQATKQEQQRELRRLQRAADKAAAQRDRALSEAKALRREVKREARRADAAERPRAPTRSDGAPKDTSQRAAAGTTRSAARPRIRRALPAPPGLLEDDPATLVHWLGAVDVGLLVDGYNVARQDGAFPALSPEDQRARTIDEVTRIARRHGVPTTVVFDGADVAPGTSPRRRGLVKVEFSRPPESGDDHVVALLASWPPSPVVVATSDKGLQERCRPRGATIATSEQLLAALR